MRTLRPAALLLIAALLSGCGNRFLRAAYPPPENVRVPADRLRAAAYAYYGREDYVRALRFAYRAARVRPADLRAPLLLGLIYDRGLDRPGLAVSEYRQVLALRPPDALAAQLRCRMQYLYRVACQRRAARALASGPAPLPADRIAVFPFQPAGPLPVDADLGLGLSDLLVYDLQEIPGAGNLHPLELHLLSQAFRTARPHADPADYARWVGARRTLTGTLLNLGQDRVRVVLQVLGPDGTPLYTAPPLTAAPSDLDTLRTALLSRAADGLGLPPPPSQQPRPVSSTLSLLLEAGALHEYLLGRTDDAWRDLKRAQKFDPGSPLIARTLTWAERDRAGRREKEALAADYRRLSTEPDPAEAAKRRLRATQALTDPPGGEVTGLEPLDPYKPPHPEAGP